MTRDGLRLFYADSGAAQGGRVALGPEESAHVHRVLKMKAGAICRVATGDGLEYVVRMTEISAEGCAGEILDRLPERPPSPLLISLGVPLLRGERFEWALQKGCELGVGALHPLALDRCEVRVQEKNSAARHRRWRRIVLETAKQCDRVPPPMTHPLGGLEDFLAGTGNFDLKLMGFLGEGAVSVKQALSGARERANDAPLRVALLTGPEGDFTNEESRRAMDAGFSPVSLGPRVLRADTAPVALAAIAQHALGDMG